jgi:S1-C subfamily serine protease
VFDDKGTIVTNNHVVADANGNVRVRFKDDGSLIKARVLGTDVSSDLAVLRVDPREVDKLVPLKVADSDDVQTGDPAIAIGYPLGLDQTTTAGIISGVGRQISAQNNFQIDSVLQTDAPINSGNSGGPLLNAKGEVVGVNSQIATTGAGGGSIGIGYAIPSDTVEKVVPKLENGQSVAYPYLGVSVADSPDGDGALVGTIQPGSPASRAGLRANSVAAQNGVSSSDGDTILKIDGKDVSRSSDVTSTINQHQPGDRLKLEVRRGGSTRTVEVTLGTRPRSATPSTPSTRIPTTPSSPSSPSDPTNPLSPSFP